MPGYRDQSNDTAQVQCLRWHQVCPAKADVDMKTAATRSGRNRYIKGLSQKIVSSDHTGVDPVDVIDDCLKEEGIQ